MSFHRSGSGCLPLSHSGGFQQDSRRNSDGEYHDQQPIPHTSQSEPSLLFQALFHPDEDGNSISSDRQNMRSASGAACQNWLSQPMETASSQNLSLSNDSMVVSTNSSCFSISNLSTSSNDTEHPGWKISSAEHLAQTMNVQSRRSSFDSSKLNADRSDHVTNVSPSHAPKSNNVVANHRRSQISVSGVIPTPAQQGLVLPLNPQCFDAGISESFAPRGRRHDGYVSKMKNIRTSSSHPYSHGSATKLTDSSAYQRNHHRHRHQQNLQNLLKKSKLQQQQQQLDQLHDQDKAASVETLSTLSSSLPSALPQRPTVSIDLASYKTDSSQSLPDLPPFTNFSTPAIPGIASSVSSTNSSNFSSDKFSSKKNRYNQTALALEQSGLMKTTVKTAELLRKSHALQNELNKLRRETTIFLYSVLSNPENKHIKDMYLKNKPPSGS